MFRNQTVLITGAAGGLGSALARKFAGLGAALMLLDKDSKGLDLIHDAICEAGLDAPGICPNSSASIRSRDRAPQFTATNGERAFGWP